MPELPDITVYLDALRARIQDRVCERLRLFSAFVLRSVDPPVAEAEGRRVVELQRLGKRIVLALEDDLFLVLHLMVAGRLHWRKPGATTRISRDGDFTCSASSHARALSCAWLSPPSIWLSLQRAAEAHSAILRASASWMA